MVITFSENKCLEEEFKNEIAWLKLEYWEFSLKKDPLNQLRSLFTSNKINENVMTP